MLDLVKLSVKKKRNHILVFERVVQVLPGNFDHHELIVHQQDAKTISLAEVSPGDENLYVAIDTASHEAFGHWFFESLVFLDELLLLTKRYPKIKILLLSNKSYKLDFLLPFNFEYTTEINCNNKVILLPRTTSLNLNEDVHDFKNKLINFRELIRGRMERPQERVDTVLIPRQRTDNYAPNDRLVDSSDIEFQLSMRPHSFVIDTSISGSVTRQCSLVGHCHNLIVPDGSGFLVNAFIANDAQIIVLGANLILNQAKQYDKISTILDLINSRNDVIFVNCASNHFEWIHVEPFVTNFYTGGRQVARQRNSLIDI